MPYNIRLFSEVPQVPAIYALYEKNSVAYVGISGSLKDRLNQHFFRRDSSATTSVGAVSLNPDFITRIDWWLHEDFADNTARQAAELIAFKLLDPVMRSRGKVQDAAQALAGDDAFRIKIENLFGNDPSGTLQIPTMQDLLERIEALEQNQTDS